MLLRNSFPKSRYYNLLERDLFLRLSARPELIREELSLLQPKTESPIIVDEIQKMPSLLDEVHNLIENNGFTFILTGSSPRKLKSGGVNLLGGRARTQQLFPLSFREIPNFDLKKALLVGTLPSIYYSDEPWQDLASYCGNYLYEEIQSEGAARNIGNFSRFLHTAALYNSEHLNFENVASDCSVSARTVREYFKILEDTLIGTVLPPYGATRKRKPVSTSKFYFFDLGIVNQLSGRHSLPEKTDEYGKAFEHFIFTELRSYLSYLGDFRPLTFWRSRNGDEVDFVIGDELAVEVKSTSLVNERQIKGLIRIGEEVAFKHKLVVSMDPTERTVHGVRIVPWKLFVNRLWSGEYD